MNEKRRLVVTLETTAERDRLLAFLRERRCDVGPANDTSVAIDDCDHAVGGIATLVALLDDWRSGAGVPEAVLELDDQRTILRTDA